MSTVDYTRIEPLTPGTGPARARREKPSRAKTPKVRGRWRRLRWTLTGVALIAVAVVAAVAVLSNGAHWSPRILAAQAAVDKACSEADTSAGDVNFACGGDTKRILWVLATVTSHDDPNYNGLKWRGLVNKHDPAAAKVRVGLIPMLDSVGSQLYPLYVKSLQAKAPSAATGYRVTDPTSSVLAAAQAINNMIVGGYGWDPVTGSPGNIKGFESYPAACQAYTGSDQQTTKFGLTVCKQPIVQEGFLALVRDIVTQWVGKDHPDLVQAALTLFQHPDPGDEETQAVLGALHLLN
jgi:hypothetical protein